MTERALTEAEITAMVSRAELILRSSRRLQDPFAIQQATAAARLAADLRRAREALEEFGTHHDNCQLVQNGGKCNCGLFAMIYGEDPTDDGA